MLAFLLGLAAARLAPAAAQITTPEVETVATRLEAEIEKILRETGIPAISIAVVRDGEVAWTGSYGYANVGAQVPATTETYFSTGSTFKFVTATAVMQLVEKGDITLDTPLNDIVAAELAIEGADDVTLRHLLSHHSGLRGPVNIVPLWSREAPMSPESLLSKTERVDEPGTEFRYCNECYALAGHVIETVSGRAYDEYVAENILRPLGVDIEMASIPSPQMVEHLALPYNLAGNAPVPIGQVRYDVFAAGDIYLRPADMARFLAAQLRGGVYGDARIISEASAEEMRRRQFDGRNYGLGVGMADFNGHAIINHSGGIPGFNSRMVGEPETGHGVYIMSNSGQSARAIGPLARYAMQLLWGEDPDPLPSFASVEHVEVEVSRELFDEYVGDYALTPEFVISVTRVGGRFFVQATGQGRVEIFAESETDFFMRAVEASITFGRDEDGGPVTHLVLHQGGANQRAERQGKR
jgi:CubicO group peptidase (beta-lactamase class C family)